MSAASQARDEIKAAIEREHVTIQAAADGIGVHVTNLYAFLRGGRLKAENAGKLRALLPSISDSTWADAFAPTPDPTVTQVTPQPQDHDGAPSDAASDAA